MIMAAKEEQLYNPTTKYGERYQDIAELQKSSTTAMMAQNEQAPTKLKIIIIKAFPVKKTLFGKGTPANIQ